MYVQKVTLNDIYNFLKNYNVSLMLHSEDKLVTLYKVKEWFKEYYESFYNDFDSWILNLYGQFSFVNTLSFPRIADILDETKWNDSLLMECISFLQSQYNSTSLVHDYEMTTLLESTLFDYNAIENYSMVESGKDITSVTKSGNDSGSVSNNDSVTENLGEVKTTNNETQTDNTTTENTKSATINDDITENLGEVITTVADTDTVSKTTASTESGTNSTEQSENLGNTRTSTNSTTNNPSKTETSENMVAPFDSAEYKPKEKNIISVEYGADTNTSNEVNTDSVTNTLTKNDSNNKTVNGTESATNEKDSTTTTNAIVNSKTTTNESNSTDTTTNSGNKTTENTSTTNKVTNTTTTINSSNNSSTFSNLENSEINHELKRSGNIGTTTTQQMIMSEREVALFSIFCHYWSLFYNDNLILIDDSWDWNDCIYG